MQKKKPHRIRSTLTTLLLLGTVLLQTACGADVAPDDTTPPLEGSADAAGLGAAVTTKKEGTLSSVEVTITEETYILPFAVTYTYTDKYAEGEQVILETGEDGTLTRTWRTVTVDGVETARTMTAEKVKAAAHPQVIAIGTRKLPSAVPTGTYVWPTESRRITSAYGRRWLQGKADFHYGIDIAGGIGAAVYATDGGKVVYAGKTYGSEWSYGNLIIVDHGNGVTSYYAHLSRVLVSVGDKVYQGQKIGLVGATGNVTGPHLHFEIRKNGITKNPLNYVKR